MRELLRKNVKFLRERVGLTQEDLAESAKLSTKMIQKVEYGKVAPSPETLDKICKALKAQPYDLFFDYSVPDAVREPIVPYGKPDKKPSPSFVAAAEFLELFENLPPDRKALVAMFVYDDPTLIADDPDLAHAASILLKGLKPVK